jgi:uncharacterized protein YfaS (alpha-2-macroglobulin family)
MKNKQMALALGILLILVVVVTAVSVIFTSKKNLPIEAQPIGLRVVAQTPIEGQRLQLDSTIELTFDRDMEQTKTAGAFSLQYADAFSSLGELVAGEVTWRDARTLVFTPSSALTPSSNFKAVISTDAEAADGTKLSDPIELDFATIESLAVSQVIPAAGTPEVDLSSTITVIFNHPIVPLMIKEEQSKLPQPLTFTPELKGKGTWVNSSVYVFEPEKGLLSGTSYQVQVEAGLTDTNGNPLEESFKWEFETRQPIISFYELVNGASQPNTEVSDVKLDQAFYVEFAQPMIEKSVESETKIIDRETKEVIPVTFKWEKDIPAVTITPKANYKLSGFYSLIVNDAAQAMDGGHLKEGLDLQFATVPYPSIKSVYPADGTKVDGFTYSLSIVFASPMDYESLKERVQVTPAIPGGPQWYYSDYDKTLYIYGLEPATDYVVRTLPGMKDVYGNEIKDGMAFQFSNGDFAPYASLALPWTPLMYRSTGQQDVYFEYLNIDEANVSVYPITPLEFYQFTNGNVATTGYQPKGQAVREWTLKSNGKNKTEHERLDMIKNGSPLPNGYYFIGLKSDSLNYASNFYQGNVFLVASDNVTFKSTPTEGLAWVTNLEDGSPRKDVNVTFYDAYFKRLGTAKTDKDGLAYLKDIKLAQYAIAETGDDFGFTAAYWGSGVSTGDFGIYENYYSGMEDIFGYLYTDRPVYRPNQDVFFKGILRKNDDLHYSLPTQKKIYVVVEQWGNKIFSDFVDVNEQGSFTGSVHLTEGLSLGYYYIEAYRTSSPNEAPIASVNFNVAEYKKPEFEVAVTPDKTDTLAGDTVNFGMDAVYYSGGDVKGAPVSWFIQSYLYTFSPSSDYGQYSFSDWDRDVYDYQYNNGVNTDTLKEGEGVTDANGHFDVSYLLDYGDDKRSRSVEFYSNITDVAGNTVSGGATVIMHQSKVYAGIRSESYVGQQGDESKFDVVTLDWNSNPVPGQSISVEFVERQWFSVQEKDKQGQLQWVTSVKDIPAGAVKAVTGDDGKAVVGFTPVKGGVYKAIVTVQDAKGNTHQSSTYLWVTSSEYIAWQQTNDRTFEVIADKDLYTPGDTAKLLIAQPFQGKVYALVTYERGHIYKSEVIQLEGSSTVYDLPITDELAPVAYVSVTVISGAENSDGIPDFKIGMAKINIDTDQKTLDVTVTADKESAGPGDEVTYTIETKDINGKPVTADVSLALVDKAVLALAPPNSPDMLPSFYPEKGLSVLTALGLVSNADEFNDKYKESIADGSGSGGGGGGEPGIITVRENFKDTAAFEAHVVTDKNGRAEVTVTLPENLTTWVADVRAVTEDSRVGQASHELLTTKPLFIQLQTPRFFVVGDEVQVGALIHNNTDKPMNVTAELNAEGAQIKSEVQQGSVIEARQQAYVTWNIVVDDNAYRVDLTATVKSDKYTDASKPALGTLPNQGIPVLNFVTEETVGTSGVITSGDSVTEMIQLPTSYDFTDAQLNIEMSPSLAASMQTSLTYLEDYEYMCMEQTVSRFLPNVITSRALKLAGINSSLNDNLDRQVSVALQRIYAKQKYDGGWNWWDGENSDPYTSAYVVYGLIEAKESGYDVSETVLENGINYLQLNLTEVKRNDDSWKFNRRAFMLYVLARGDKLVSGQTNLIFEYREGLDLYGKAYLAQAMHLLDPEDPRIDTLMSDLESAAALSSSGTHWEEKSKDYWNWNSDTRSTAIILNAFTQINPKSPVTANAVRWLMAHREKGHWYSTQETSWSLIALTNWLTVSKEFETDYNYAIGLNGNPLKEGEATKDNLTQTVDLQVEMKDLLKEEANNLVFSRGRGNGNMYYSAYLTATLPVEQVQPLDQGMTISREYFALDDLKTPITEIGRGELVKVRLTMVIPASMHYLVVDDPLPAGLEAVDSTLATDVAVPTSYTIEDYDKRGWGWWYFSHTELKDEKVVLSADYLPAGTYVYTYIARASTIGTFKVIPPTASEFYFPDVGGRGAGSVFIVK